MPEGATQYIIIRIEHPSNAIDLQIHTLSKVIFQIVKATISTASFLQQKKITIKSTTCLECAIYSRGVCCAVVMIYTCVLNKEYLRCISIFSRQQFYKISFYFHIQIN